MVMKSGMVRSGIALALLAIVVGITNTPVLRAASKVNNLIVPGESIGQVHLGARGDADLEKLGKPDALDAATSQTRQVWISKTRAKDTFFVHTISNGALDVQPLNGVTVDEMRVTSSFFRTHEGLRTGDTLSQIRRHFPHVERVDAGQTVGNTVLYEDGHAGIGFEFERDSPTAKCIGISVFTPGPGPAAGHTVSRKEVMEIVKER